MNLRVALPISLTCLLLLGGCATSRSELDITPPTTTNATPTIAGKEVLVTVVSDKRIFQANPPSADIPSLDPGRDQNTAIKARAVGRKRNTFGKALGDILLKEGQTVESLTAASIRQAFVEKGYKVLDSKEQATGNTVFVEATIDKFWSWFSPGFWAITLNTEIASGVSIKSAEKDTTAAVSVKASEHFQVAAEGNWTKVINNALRAFVDELKTKLE